MSAKKYDQGGDIHSTLKNGIIIDIHEPVDYLLAEFDALLKTRKKIWKHQVSGYVKQDAKLTENMKNIYSLVLGQCS